MSMYIKTSSALLCLAAMSLPLAAQMTAPKVGTVRYWDGSLHSVQGLPGNLIVCDLSLDSADAASFSDNGGIVSQKGTIRLLGSDLHVIAEYPSSEVAPLLSMDGDLNSALAWLPSMHLLLHWDGNNFAEISIADADLGGQVKSLQSLSQKQARLLVTDAGGNVFAQTFSTRNGSLVSSEPLIGVHGYAFGQSFLFVYTDKNELVADNLHGYRRSIALPAGDLVIERMSNQWLHLSSATLKQDWALHLTQADLQLSLLPAVVPPNLASTVALPKSASGVSK